MVLNSFSLSSRCRLSSASLAFLARISSFLDCTLDMARAVLVDAVSHACAVGVLMLSICASEHLGSRDMYLSGSGSLDVD